MILSPGFCSSVFACSALEVKTVLLDELSCYYQLYQLVLLYRVYVLNLGCLHPVARVISYDMGFNPSTQR
jgi:hypothetical protein